MSTFSRNPLRSGVRFPADRSCECLGLASVFEPVKFRGISPNTHGLTAVRAFRNRVLEDDHVGPRYPRRDASQAPSPG